MLPFNAEDRILYERRPLWKKVTSQFAVLQVTGVGCEREFDKRMICPSAWLELEFSRPVTSIEPAEKKRALCFERE